ncbi:ranBP-type and C3HC4-type zinc finger-containing protein 1-like isoform X2 [Patiria miniata]|uniref:RanBP-type and C3HC4-type zinc finger-containing protein 1 n=1 Tax=Patiria miniata TaxID=46514 RepID=A0A914AU80_PATMI|nr:ranBP-type and C3HC4-type zinc finger-containing protein 1-like isoform X2 [Patiria miniata]
MNTPTREEILLVLRGSFCESFDESLGKWKGPFTPAKFQILQSENDFMLRISTDIDKQSDPLVFVSCRKISSVKKLTEVLLQINLRGTPISVAFCIQFTVAKDQNHFFLILKNAAEELKSRAYDRGMSNQQPNSPGSAAKPKPTDQLEETSRAPMATMVATHFAGVSSGSESPVKGAEMDALIANLQRQVAAGDSAGACETITILAQKKTKLSMSVDEIGDLPGIRSKFKLEVHVEDIQSSGAKIKLSDVTPNMTIGYLKKLVFTQYNFPVEVQCWIIGRRIIRDFETLMACRINSSTPVFLYLISAEKAGITQQQAQMSRQAMMAQPMQMGMMRQVPAPIPPRDAHPILAATANPGLSLPSRSSQREPTRDMPVFSAVPPIPQPLLAPRKPTAEQVGWHCPACTLINPPTVPGCRVCMEGRPASYQVPAPDSYIMDPEEKAKQDELLRNERLIEEMERKQKLDAELNRDTNYQALLMADTPGLIPNAEEFECLICYSEVPAGEGVLLRECLHTFCKDCLQGHISHNREPVIMCPYNDGTYTCPEALLEREIKALASPEEFAHYLQRGLTVAESQDPNSFHCKTPDCAGFCFYDDNINFFQCPICGKENCLTCKAIHQGLNCKEYQDDLQRRAANDKAALMTKMMLEKMISSGEAMKCPQCSIIMVKKEGCDWIMCSMCKLEVCWVTKGPRWGPAGNGDTTGGCKCRLNAKRCHPKCQNCH